MPTSTLTFLDYAVISRWEDEYLTDTGIPMMSSYVEHYWLPLIGPTALCVARRMTEMLGDREDICLDMDQLARGMGLSTKRGEHSPFFRAVNRLHMFGLMAPALRGYAIRSHVPVVPMRWRRMWSRELEVAHESEGWDL